MRGGETLSTTEGKGGINALASSLKNKEKEAFLLFRDTEGKKKSFLLQEERKKRKKKNGSLILVRL